MKQHRTLLRGLGILLALTMGLCLLAATALADTAQKVLNFADNPTDAVGLLNAYYMGKAEWDDSNKTLTLKGLNFATEAAIAVKLPAGSTIVLEAGTINTIKSTNTDTGVSDSHGIYCDGDLTITGSGTLTVTGGAAQYRSNGISITGNLNINSGTVKAYGSSNALSSTGIDAGGTVKVTSGTVTATGSDSTKNSHGIYAWGVDISGGTVTAIGGSSSKECSVGIWTQGTVNISGDDTVVTATGGTAKTDSHGIWTQDGDWGYVTISGGTVTVTGSNAEDSCGIRAGTHGGNKITISGGHVTARTLATTATYKSALDGTLDLSGYPKYQWRTSADAEYTTAPYVYDAAHTYVEFDKVITVITGDQTADFIGDTATALDVLTNNDPGKAAWDSATKTLTLKGVSFSTTADIAVKLPGGSNIVLAEGTKNTITSNSSSESTPYSYGIYVNGGNLTIKGSGQLAVTGGTAKSSDGISVYSGSLTIDSGTINTTGGAASGSYGIFTDLGVTINGGTVTATGSSSTAGVLGSSHGIRTNRDVTITGGTVTATGSTAGYSRGIKANGTVSISGGTVTATAGKSIDNSFGIETGKAAVTGGTVIATGGTAGTRSYGIFADEAAVTGGTVTATGDTAGKTSGGIDSVKTITVSGKDTVVTATGGKAETSYGIWAEQDKTIISGGRVTARTLAGAGEGRAALSAAPDLSAYTGCYWRTGPDDYYYDTAYPYSQAHTYVEFAPEGETMPIINDLPETGDNSNVLLWIVLLLASGLGITGTVVHGRRSKYAK